MPTPTVPQLPVTSKKEATSDQNDKDFVVKPPAAAVIAQPPKTSVSTQLTRASTPAQLQPKVRKVRKRRSPRKIKNFETEDYDEELERLKATGIRTKDHTRDLCRRMIRTTDLNQRLVMAKLLKSADPPCRRLFIDYRGLFILGNWISDLEGHGQVELGNYNCK